MCFHFPKVVGLVLLFYALAAHARELKVCADPDNLPFSNRNQQGFENKIAELLAHDMHAQLKYEWQRMGRGFVREYLGKSRCDLLVGIPVNYKPILTTAPYYRSTFVFVTRRQRNLRNLSLNDPALHTMKIGVQALDEEYAPPGDALARRGMQASIVAFDTTGPHPDSIMRAVAQGEVDAAIVWGPQAGYFARRYGSGIVLTPVTPQVDPPGIPFTFAIAMGVRQGNIALRDELQHFITRRKSAIEHILRAYGVPELEMAPTPAGGE
jgi:mxaJ protein